MPPATTLLIFLFLSVAHAQEVATLSIDSGGVVRVQSGGVLEVGDPPPPPPPPPSPPPALPPASALERRPGGGWRYDNGGHALSCAEYLASGFLPTELSNGGESGAVFDIGPPGDPYETICLFHAASQDVWTMVWRSGPSEEVDNYQSTHVVDHEFLYNRSAWTHGRGSAQGISSFVSRAWNTYANPTKLMFGQTWGSGWNVSADVWCNNPTFRVQWLVTNLSSCMPTTPGATLADASGLCATADGVSPTDGIRPLRGSSNNAGQAMQLYLNTARQVAECSIDTRVSWDTHLWDNGDSGQVKGVGYDYQAAMGGSTSCTCPAQNKCGEELTASANLFGYAMFVA